jgi:hypothetical protein
MKKILKSYLQSLSAREKVIIIVRWSNYAKSKLAIHEAYKINESKIKIHYFIMYTLF